MERLEVINTWHREENAAVARKRMRETKQSPFTASKLPLHVQARYFNSTPTTNNKKADNKNDAITPARGAPHQYRKVKINCKIYQSISNKQLTHGIVDMKHT
jgi:hypothetical protein